MTAMQHIKQGLIDYFEMEFYNEDEDTAHMKEEISNLDSHNDFVPIAYTTVGNNEEFELQTSLNLKDQKLITEITGEFITDREVIKYHDLSEIADEIPSWNFDDLITVDADIDELSNKERQISQQTKETIEQQMNHDYKGFVKELISTETNIKDEKTLDETYNFFIESDETSLLDQDIHSATNRIHKANMRRKDVNMDM